MASPPRAPSPDYNTYVTPPYPLPMLSPRPMEKPLVDIYLENKDWFEHHIQRQKELSQERFNREVRKKMFGRVIKSEPVCKKGK